ncbi:MAG: SPOR domain-containing protein, partial [Mariprofundaceae bacterium]|nr:SPOR domain-containing protein [Mariprofundaceae bacterium]
SKVSDLEEQISQLKEPAINSALNNDVADIGNKLESVAQALSNHLKSVAQSRNPHSHVRIRPSVSPQAQVSLRPSTRRVSPSLPIQPIPGSTNQAISPRYSNANNTSLPPPVSSPTYAPAPRRMSSGWVVNITSVSDSESAYQEVARLKSMGINAESARAYSNGRTWYRIRIPGFASHDEAIRARPSLEARLGIRDTWVGKRE